jgi:lipid II:glycine glycyltransferase (peptidoglycan interpeptide bridge formation enzyme)
VPLNAGTGGAHGPALVPTAKTDIRDTKTGAVKYRFCSRKIENCFSAHYTHIGERKKYKAHISKYVRPFLKFLRPFFRPLKTRLKTA